MSLIIYALVKELMAVVFGLGAYFGGIFSPFHPSIDFTRECQMTNSIKQLDENELV